MLRLLFILGQLFTTSAYAHVELHAHLFMNEGLTWIFRGDFFGPIKAKKYTDGLSSQTNPETLNASENRIVVVSLYAHPLLSPNMRESVRKQIALAERFVSQYPQWIIARSPHEAETAIQQGKRVLVLALEGASGIIEDAKDIREFVKERGVRIITLLHLTDDHLGGAAFLGGINSFASPWAWIKNWFDNHRSDEGIRANSRGLSEAGESLTRSLIQNQVWIDLAHSSDEAQERLIAIHEERKIPLLYTHTVLRKHQGAERALSEAQLQAVARSGGIIGLMPSEKMLGNTPVENEACPKGGIRALAIHFQEAAEKIGADHVSLGSDFNGSISHLRPAQDCPTGISTIDEEGLVHIGQTPAVWQGLEKLTSIPINQERRVKAFLNAWRKAYRE